MITIVRLKRVYHTPKGKLRAKITLENDNIFRTYTVKCGLKSSSFISGQGYGLNINYLDFALQRIGFKEEVTKQDFLLQAGCTVKLF